MVFHSVVPPHEQNSPIHRWSSTPLAINANKQAHWVSSHNANKECNQQQVSIFHQDRERENNITQLQKMPTMQSTKKKKKKTGYASTIYSALDPTTGVDSSDEARSFLLI
jgi:hypothetical protein